MVAVAVVSLACEYMDASIGMGYGTTLSPILLAIGFAPLEVVPAVLIGQLAGGLVGGLAHHRLGNISLDFRRDREIKGRLGRLGYLPRSTDGKIVFILAITGIVGAIVGTSTAVTIPETALKIYIGAMVAAVGVVILLRRIRQGSISWKGLIGVGLISSFNKSMSGGGYGPLVTGGQIISGGGVRNSVGNTTLAEGLVCAVGFVSYLVLDVDIFWRLAAATSIGSVAAAPFAAMTVRKVSPNKLKYAIALATLGLGIFTLANALG